MNGTGTAYAVTTTRDGRRVDVPTGRGLVEVTALTGGGTPVRTARFMASGVLAVVEHPAAPVRLRDDEQPYAA